MQLLSLSDIPTNLCSFTSFTRPLIHSFIHFLFHPYSALPNSFSHAVFYSCALFMFMLGSCSFIHWSANGFTKMTFFFTIFYIRALHCDRRRRQCWARLAFPRNLSKQLITLLDIMYVFHCALVSSRSFSWAKRHIM